MTRPVVPMQAAIGGDWERIHALSLLLSFGSRRGWSTQIVISPHDHPRFERLVLQHPYLSYRAIPGGVVPQRVGEANAATVRRNFNTDIRSSQHRMSGSQKVLTVALPVQERASGVLLSWLVGATLPGPSQEFALQTPRGTHRSLRSQLHASVAAT